LHSPGVAIAVLLFAFAGVSRARAEIISPTAQIAGQSQLSHALQWWQTMVNFSLANNPITDPTGANAYLGQQPGQVLYLAGSFGAVTNRSTSVPPGTTLFFPLVNTFADNTALIGDPPTNYDPQQLLDLVSPGFDNPVSLFLEIDGQLVLNTAQAQLHRQTSDPNDPPSVVVQSVANLYLDLGLDPTLGMADPFDPGSYPSTIFPFMVEGYWVGLGPFAPGSTHTIRYGAVLQNGFTQDNTFVITTTPEPASWLVWAGAMSLVGLVAYRRRRRKLAR